MSVVAAAVVVLTKLEACADPGRMPGFFDADSAHSDFGFIVSEPKKAVVHRPAKVQRVTLRVRSPTAQFLGGPS